MHVEYRKKNITYKQIKGTNYILFSVKINNSKIIAAVWGGAMVYRVRPWYLPQDFHINYLYAEVV